MFHAESSCHMAASVRVEVLVQSMSHMAQFSREREPEVDPFEE